MDDIHKGLREYLAPRENFPFRWGFHDCFTFTADWVGLLANVPSPADPLKRKYTNALGASRHLIRMGGTSWDDLPGLRFPVTEIKPPYAQAGDIVTITDPERGPCLGICEGKFAVFLGETSGYVRLPHADIERAWRVDA